MNGLKRFERAINQTNNRNKALCPKISKGADDKQAYLSYYTTGNNH